MFTAFSQSHLSSGVLPQSYFFRLNFRTEFVVYSFLLLLNPFLVTSIRVIVISHFVLAVQHKRMRSMLYSFFWVIPQHLNFMCWRFGTLCSILIGCVCRKNNWDEIVGVLIQEKVWLKNILSQSKGGDMERVCRSRETGCGGQRPPNGGL